MLEEETKRMEEKLEQLKKIAELEKEKRSLVKKAKDGTVWRSATTQKAISGYSKMVVDNHRKAQPVLPPTSLVTDTGSNFNSAKPPPGAGSSAKKQTQQQQKAAANLDAAIKQQQQSENKEVEEFLGSINLSKYADVFIDNGVEDLETILELDEKHLEQMSVPLGHKLKIMKRIKDLRKDANPVEYSEGVSTKPHTQ